MHWFILLCGLAFCAAAYALLRAGAREVVTRYGMHAHRMTRTQFLRFDADQKARRLQMFLDDDPSKRPGAGFGRGAVDRLPSELPQDPALYAVPFTMRGGPRDGETVDVTMSALVGAHLGRLTLESREAYLHDGDLVRDQHVYEPSADEPQTFDYVGTYREPAGTEALTPSGLEGDL